MVKEHRLGAGEQVQSLGVLPPPLLYFLFHCLSFKSIISTQVFFVFFCGIHLIVSNPQCCQHKKQPPCWKYETYMKHDNKVSLGCTCVSSMCFCQTCSSASALLLCCERHKNTSTVLNGNALHGWSRGASHHDKLHRTENVINYWATGVSGFLCCTFQKKTKQKNPHKDCKLVFFYWDLELVSPPRFEAKHHLLANTLPVQPPTPPTRRPPTSISLVLLSAFD